MDPMLEIARGFLKTEREAASKVPDVSDTRDAHSCDIFPEDIYGEIHEQIKHLSAGMIPTREGTNSASGTQEFLWEFRDERVQDVLADVFYTKPHIARRLCEIKPGLIPAFVHYLAQEAHRYWQIEKSGAASDLGTKKLLHQLFEEYKYVVHETFPDAFELALIEKPKFMEALANHLKTSLPFSMALKGELEEITNSRKVRLRSDPDARGARVMDEILRIRSRLARLKDIGDRGVMEREEKHLQEKESKLREMIRRGGRRRVEEERDWNGAGLQQPQEPSRNEVFRFPPKKAEEMSLFGLALSGGGIRSATFNLGVLQGLADLDLLRRLDYLSGVSGGSHIGAWLGAWIKREPNGIRRVQRWLSPLRSPTPDTDENHPIQFLRRFSSYLAPRKGLLSADTWSIFTIWLRNTILNQLVFILLLASLLTVPKLIFAALDKSTWLFIGDNDTWIGASIMLLAIALAALVGLNLYRFDPGERASSEKRKTPFLWTQFGVQTTVVLGCMVLGFAGAVLIFHNAELFSNWKRGWAIFSLAILATLASMHMSSRAWRLFLSQRPGEVPSVSQRMRAIAAVFLIAAASALVAGAAFQASLHHYEQSFFASWAALATRTDGILKIIQQSDLGRIQGEQLSQIVALGPAFVIGILSVAMLLQIGLMGHNLPDNRREWWGRMGAMLLIALGFWTALSACSLWGPLWAQWLKTKNYSMPLSLLWLAVTAFGSKWGFSGQTPSATLEKGSTVAKPLHRLLRTAPRDWIALVAPYFYIAGLAIFLSLFLYAIPLWVRGISPSDVIQGPSYWDHLVSPSWLPPAMLAAMLALAAIFAWRFDVNEFSMHSFYRNRLVRCYLGASRAGQRKPNLFTGFDSEDDMRLSLLRVNPPVPKDLSRAARPYRGPFLIFNTALNLVAGKELAWQERKATSFVFTPLYCGYELAPGTAYHQSNLANFGYRPTVDYAEPDSLGPGLGTSMATSGAAVNPNMGYHYSAALSFLMALFNVRLGCWMGNPRHRMTWKQSSPRSGLAYLVNELIGGTNDTSRFINLSDGGHFENLGIYELVRRHCMYIIVCDAEEDLPFSFQGLANAIRKCRADFGIDIRLDPDQLRPVLITEKDPERSRTHCALGDIVYSPEKTGKLLYIKTSLTGDEPGDVLGYKLRHSSFPHQSTFNQFFDESQFESYRALGLHIAMAILQRATEYTSEDIPEQVKPADTSAEDARHSDLNKKFLQEIFQSLKAMWYPPTANMVALRDRHRELFDHLIAMFHSSDKSNLEGAARTFFRTSDNPKGSFLAYSEMIELMHRVFQDLDLEIMLDHPHNEGWMNIFRGWAGDKSFRKVWAVARDNYDNRFKTFCSKELNLDPGPPGKSRDKWAA